MVTAYAPPLAIGMLKVKEPLAETARSFAPLFRSTRLAPVARPDTVPPTVPDVGGVVVLPLVPPQAARRRDEASSTASVENLLFKGGLSIGPGGCPLRRCVGTRDTGHGTRDAPRSHLMRVNSDWEGSNVGPDRNNPGGVLVPGC